MTFSSFGILSDEGIAWEKVAARTDPPKPFVRGDEFWDDPYISEQLLEAHLDPDRDAASRPHDRIDAEVEWLISALSLEAGDAILDLGCGPGLYCERLHDRGMNVTGVDISQTALNHARTRAENTGRDITYRRKDYRTLDDEAAFDAAVLVNFDFGTFVDEDRNEILRGVHDALIPDGRFAFDAYTEHQWAAADIGTEWNLQDGAGFWRPTPHLVLSETVPYPDAELYLDQHCVVDESGEVIIYRFWERYYDVEQLTALLNDHGYVVKDVFEDFQGTAHTDDSKSVSIVACKS